MKPLPLAAVAFAAGLIPGLFLYWTSGQNTKRPLPASPIGAISVPTTTPPTITAPTVVAIEKKSIAKPSAPLAAATPQNIALLEQQLSDRAGRLANTEANLNETKTRLNESEAKIATLTEQSAQAQVNEKTLQQGLETATRQFASLQSDLKSRDTKAADADAAQLKMLKQSADSAQKSAAKTSELANELEEIARRRETYLSQILSRYREATELFRAMSLRMDNPRDAGSPLNNDLSRIQQAVQHAEEDLRQLRSLNQGSTRLMKELAAARVKK